MKLGFKILFIIVAILSVVIFATLANESVNDGPLLIIRTSLLIGSLIVIGILFKKDKTHKLRILKQILTLIPVLFIGFVLEGLRKTSTPVSNDFIMAFYIISVLIIFGGPILFDKLRSNKNP